MQVTQLIQVSWDIHDQETRQREIDGLLEASAATGCQNLIIITFDEEGEIIEQGQQIQIIPVWKWTIR